jgi:hypothetical protein
VGDDYGPGPDIKPSLPSRVVVTISRESSYNTIVCGGHDYGPGPDIKPSLSSRVVAIFRKISYNSV